MELPYTQVLLMFDLFTHVRLQTPIGLQELFFWPILTFAPSSPRHHFFASPLPLFSLHDDKRTSERTNEQTKERTVTLPFSLHVRLYLPLLTFCRCIVLFLLTLDRPRQ
jgi:hypothetical protein